MSLLWLILVLASASVSLCHAAHEFRSGGCGRALPHGATLGVTRQFEGALGGSHRRWHVHVPSSYDPKVAVPVVLAMHGWARTAEMYETESGLSLLSEIHGFIVAYPEGMDDHAGADSTPWGSWNVVGTSIGIGPKGPTCEAWADPQGSMCYNSCKPCTPKPHCQWATCVNDITPSGVGTKNVTGFLPKLFDLLEDQFCIDTSRLYATGCSNGGMAAYQLGVSMADRLAAIAPVCGSFMKGFVQAPSVPIPVMDVHGFFDTEVPANGTDPLSSDGYFYTQLDTIFAGWRSSNTCSDHGDSVALEHWKTPVDGLHDLYCVSEGVDCAAPVVRCGWSGPHGSFANGEGYGIPNAELVWSFLSRFTRQSKTGKHEAPSAGQLLAQSWENERPEHLKEVALDRVEDEAREPRDKKGSHHDRGLGPGSGPWSVAAPEDHGLDSEELRKAADEVIDVGPIRYCVLVVKDGKIVHEQYANGKGPDDVYEIESIGKTASALVVGAAIQAGLFDLDTPLMSYGLKPQCDPPESDCWRMVVCPQGARCPEGSLGFYPNITARHLLAQASGCVEDEGCTTLPGTFFSYDSGMYLQHLDALITKRGREPALQWAKKFMDLLGLTTMYNHDEMGHKKFSVGGGQLLTCRDIARIGQMVLNMGRWPTSDGGVKQLISKEYIEQLLTPQYLERGYTYGLLTWLNGKRPKEGTTDCCSARWGNLQTCRHVVLSRTLLSDDTLEDVDELVALGTGWLGQYLFMSPSRNLTIVTMGSSWGSSFQCPMGATLPSDPPGMDGYDDNFLFAVFWRILDKATRARPMLRVLASSRPQEVATLSEDSSVATSASTLGNGTSKTGTLPQGGLKSTMLAARSGGSCSCLCPPGRGWGFCYDMPEGTKDCSSLAVLSKAADDCPNSGATLQCEPHDPFNANCTAAGEAMRGDFGKGAQRLWGGHMTCSEREACHEVAGGATSVVTCGCKPRLYGLDGCSWDAGPCSEWTDHYNHLGSDLPAPQLPAATPQQDLAAVAERPPDSEEPEQMTLELQIGWDRAACAMSCAVLLPLLLLVLHGSRSLAAARTLRAAARTVGFDGSRLSDPMLASRALP